MSQAKPTIHHSSDVPVARVRNVHWSFEQYVDEYDVKFLYEPHTLLALGAIISVIIGLAFYLDSEANSFLENTRIGTYPFLGIGKPLLLFCLYFRVRVVQRFVFSDLVLFLSLTLHHLFFFLSYFFSFCPFYVVFRSLLVSCILLDT